MNDSADIMQRKHNQLNEKRLQRYQSMADRRAKKKWKS